MLSNTDLSCYLYFVKFVDMNLNQRGRPCHRTKKRFPTANKNTEMSQEMVLVPKDEYFMMEKKLKVLSESKFYHSFELSIQLVVLPSVRII